jgi:hypothetical protein
LPFPNLLFFLCAKHAATFRHLFFDEDSRLNISAQETCLRYLLEAIVNIPKTFTPPVTVNLGHPSQLSLASRV